MQGGSTLSSAVGWRNERSLQAGILDPGPEAPAGEASVAFFFISRFNLVLPDLWKPARFKSPGRWCRTRIPLFRDVTLPSMAGQARHGFLWLIYFDTEMNKAVSEILDIVAGYDFILPKFLDMRGQNVGHLRSRMSADIACHLTPGTHYVCTTRIDTDDAVNHEFFGNLVGKVTEILAFRPAPVGRLAISFPLGAQLNGDRASLFVYEKNPFMSLLERSDDIRTIMAFPYRAASKAVDIEYSFTTVPQWLQNIHRLNVGNRFHEELPRLRDLDQVAAWFSLDPTLLAQRQTPPRAPARARMAPGGARSTR
jgi:hypothetical protein